MSYFAEDINGELCDIIFYAYAKLENNQLQTVEWNDEDMYYHIQLSVYSNTTIIARRHYFK